MKAANITNKMAKLFGRYCLVAKKYSPEIFLAIGIGTGAACTVTACIATRKVDGVIHEHYQKKDKIHEAWALVQEGELAPEEYTEKDYKKDMAITYVQTGLEFAKLYWPAMTLGMISISSTVGGFGVMKKRNVALVAAYKAVEEGFNAYRQRVVEELGEQTDYRYKNGLKSEIVTETEIGDDGKGKKVKKTKLKVENTNDISMYAKFFDESNPNWDRTNEYNVMFLRSQQNYFNNMLQIRGHVFLNEVYDALGFERTSAGSVVGWVLAEGCDGFIDFGIFDGNNLKSREFVNGIENNILLDFNVDGTIYNLI